MTALKARTQALLDAYCRLQGEQPADVIDDAVALFLDSREEDLALEATANAETAAVLS